MAIRECQCAHAIRNTRGHTRTHTHTHTHTHTTHHTPNANALDCHPTHQHEMSTSAASAECHVVIGGSGFLGSAIIKALVGRGEKRVVNVDVRSPDQHSLSTSITGSSFEKGDITNKESLALLFASLKPNVVYHTASPLADSSSKQVYELVNVQGTQNVIEAAQEAGVKKLVFTSSASVIFDGTDLVNADERLPYPQRVFDEYSTTKARAEQLVLLANGEKNLKTCAIRPAGIFGPGDRQALPGFFKVLASGKTNFQLGDNKNLFDWTYVDNVAHAHLLAADKLSSASPVYPAEFLASVHVPLKVAALTDKADRRVPTSESRLSPPGVPDFAADLPSTLTREQRGLDGQVPTIDVRSVARNKFDQFFLQEGVESINNPLPNVWDYAKEDPGVRVDGQVFHITNGQPMPFFDFPRALWKAYDGTIVDPAKVWNVPVDLAFPIAAVQEWFGWMFGTKPDMTRFKITFSVSKRYYNIERARRALGYTPLVGMEEAIERSAKWWRDEQQRAAK
ncbi:C-3 sterol dehydrogenase/3-beta-hydroxysteroid dehydrogenase and related dehydrogenases [Ceraceosorus bombacis]|uniref:C-3 sterol dehydrogenase/3-beta-hydroxysteroid dehydrogenase and related dehydrogenases n=1 Tax=Ceraceosorus bombacis TaxID=401625 RepID=A0A0P1BQE2_9BASI|nr:C-3 sterol dehydrogenase/3-beta-hydroxysteroid dehydrogenase and related dehydrogenases [Ceraceosorus bombacis]